MGGLDRLTADVVINLERQLAAGIPAGMFAPQALLYMTKIAEATFNTIRHLCDDDTIADPNQRLSFAVSSPPLLRSLADQIFLVIGIGENVQVRMQQYLKGGWRELREAHDRLLRYQGTSPEWDSQLAASSDQLRRLQGNFGITVEEAANLKKIDYWPYPGQMLRGKMLGPENQKFLDYLEAWFNKELSQADHLSFPGLLQRGVPLCSPSLLFMDERKFERDRAHIPYVRMMTAVVLYLTFLTEIVLLCGFDLKEQCANLWTILREHAPIAEEIWQERGYEGGL